MITSIALIGQEPAQTISGFSLGRITGQHIENNHVPGGVHVAFHGENVMPTDEVRISTHVPHPVP